MHAERERLESLRLGNYSIPQHVSAMFELVVLVIHVSRPVVPTIAYSSALQTELLAKATSEKLPSHACRVLTPAQALLSL